MTDNEKTLKRMLEQMDEMKQSVCRNQQQFQSMERYVLDYGEWWAPQPLPAKYRRGVPKLCFQQSQALARRYKSLRYVEGFVMDAKIQCMPFHHGWCVDAGGRVVDVTWPEAGLAYLGVVFDLKFVREQLKGTGCCSVIDNWVKGFPLLLKEGG